MAKSKLLSTCAAAMLSLTLASAQTPPQQSPQATSAQTNGRHAPDQRAPDQPLSNRDAAKSAQIATISGCVVREAANGGKATIASHGISYKLTGRGDNEFDRYLGKRVEVTGTIDLGSATPTSGKTSETGAPKDQTATAGQSDVPVTGTPRDNTTPGVQDVTRPDAIPLATDKGTTADLTGRMQVKTIRIVSPSCLLK